MTSTAYLLSISAEDGRHFHVYPSEAAALAGLTAQLGRPVTSIDNRYVDDWGRSMRVEIRPARWTVAKERRLAEAFDRRECGQRLTPAQRRILAEFRA
jgi:hypothetical protein